MTQCKITVLDLTYNEKLAREYCQEPPGPCPVFKQGQVYVYDHSGSGEKPKGFCEHAWHDIYNDVILLCSGGDYEGWMKNKHTNVVCCTDGIRPVVFKLEKLQS